MKKFYSFVLMAMMLLLGTTAWANTYTIGEGATYADLAAFKAAMDDGTITLSSADEIVANANLLLAKNVEYDFRGATITLGSYEALNSKNVLTTYYYYFHGNVSGANYIIKNVTIKNGNSNGAIYIQKGASVTLQNVKAENCKYGLYTKIANVTLTNFDATESTYAIYASVANFTVSSNWNLSGVNYGLYYAGASLTNNGTINGIQTTADATITNNGTITKGILVAKSKSVTLINNEGASFETSENTGNPSTFTIENHGTAEINGGKIYATLTVSNVTINGGTFYNSVEATNTTINAGSFRGSVLASNLTINGGSFIDGSTLNASDLTTINGGTFNGVLSGTGFVVKGGTFALEPVNAVGTIEGECKFPIGPAIGGLTISEDYMGAPDGYIYEITNPGPIVSVEYQGQSVTYSSLEEAFASAPSGAEISLLEDVITYQAIWIGTTSINGDPKSLTLDLNGHSINPRSTVEKTFIISHGALEVKNSVPGQGAINNTCAKGAAFQLYGSYLKNCNPENQTPFTHLTVKEGVNIHADASEGNGISINELSPAMDAHTMYGVDYQTLVYVKEKENNPGKYDNHGTANGVRVDFEGYVSANKYGVKVNGGVRYPDPVAYGDGTYAYTYRQAIPYLQNYVVEETDVQYAPYIHVSSSAVIESAANTNQSAAAYASGYARWLIEGTCQGANGLYIKSGEVTLNNAIIESTTTGDAQTIVTGKTSGIEGSGNAVTIESNKNYSGESVLTINGDTKLSTEADGGAALVDVVDASHESKVEGIEINGGTFTGDQAIIISNETATSETNQILINGVLVVGDITIGGETDTTAVSSIKGQQTHITAFDNADDTRTVIVSIGVAPAVKDPEHPEVKTDWAFIAEQSDPVALPGYAWTKVEAAEIASGTIYLGELQAISGNATDGVQQLTIKNGATLQVNRLIMNDYARIIVEAGGKLIVAGEQGINAPDSTNILLMMSESDQAMFLFHPNVSSNRHPLASVQLVSKGYKNGSKYIWQRFGVPAYLPDFTRGAVIYDHVGAASAFYGYDYAIDNWKAMTDADTFVPFQCYEVTSGATVPGTLYTFKCAIMGNTNQTLGLNGNWNYYANSYTAPINIYEMLNSFVNGNASLDATVYVYRSEDNWWDAVNLMDYLFNEQAQEEIAPMQAFIFKQGNGSNESVINYEDHIYAPIMNANTGNLAPKRNRVAVSKAMIEITAADGTKDEIRLAESNMFGEDYDNGYDAAKYMNTESFNLFATLNDEEMGKLATDNLEGTMLSMTTKEQTSFVMTFKNVDNMNYAIRDMLTGTVTAIEEGASYMFSVPENANVEGRFQIVEKANMPTSIENIEETAAVKGIYTITGQFVGNDYHSLPAGVYVVDGKKIIK